MVVVWPQITLGFGAVLSGATSATGRDTAVCRSIEERKELLTPLVSRNNDEAHTEFLEKMILSLVPCRKFLSSLRNILQHHHLSGVLIAAGGPLFSLRVRGTIL